MRIVICQRHVGFFLCGKDDLPTVARFAFFVLFLIVGHVFCFCFFVRCMFVVMLILTFAVFVRVFYCVCEADDLWCDGRW